MDAMNYAAWVLKPTSNGAESTGQPLATAMSVDGDDELDAAKKTDNNTVADSAIGATGANSGVPNTVATALTETSAAEKNEEAAPLLFIDEGEEGDDEESNEAPPPPESDAVGRLPANRDEKIKVAVGDEKPPQSKPEVINIPLIDYLCALNACSLKELQLLLYNVKARKHMIAYLQQHCALRTAHLRPAERNQWLHGHDLSTQSVNHTYACNGYLELTVRQYYFAKHGLKLKHPYLPCLIEFGGGSHASYYPLEVINVVMEHTPMIPPPTSLTCSSSMPAANSESKQRTRRSPLHSIAGGVFIDPDQFPLLYKSKNNTDKSAVEEANQQQPMSSATLTSVNGMKEKMAANAAAAEKIPVSSSQQKRAGVHCCCCCCDCHSQK